MELLFHMFLFPPQPLFVGNPCERAGWEGLSPSAPFNEIPPPVKSRERALFAIARLRPTTPAPTSMAPRRVVGMVYEVEKSWRRGEVGNIARGCLCMWKRALKERKYEQDNPRLLNTIRRRNEASIVWYGIVQVVQMYTVGTAAGGQKASERRVVVGRAGLAVGRQRGSS